MWRRIQKWLQRGSQQQSRNASGNADSPLVDSLKDNLQSIQRAFGNSADLKSREVTAGPGSGWRVALVYLDDLVEKPVLHDQVVAAIQRHGALHQGRAAGADLLQLLERAVLGVARVERVQTLTRLVASLLDGNTAVLLDGQATALLAETTGRKKRSITEPAIESVVRGPRKGFVETIGVNVAQLRQILRTPRLRFKSLTLGETSQTPVWIGYLEGRVDPRVLAEVERRLRRIKAQAILESRYIEEHIADNRWTPFPLVDNTERPDKVVAALLEGRVAILTEGTPFVLLVPTVMAHLLQSPEDYYTLLHFATFARVMRTVGIVATLTFPAFYVALVSYHHEMIPTTLALALVAAQKNVPFPALIEALILELIFEALRESGLRLPGPAGQAVTMVGALILGQAAIQANLVTPMMVITVTAAGIASFTMPNYQLALAFRTLRFPLTLLAGMFGFPGVLSGLMILFFHLCSLRSFGVPYLTPIAPLRVKDLDDAYLRLPHWISRGGFQLRPRQGPKRVQIRESGSGGKQS